MKRVMAAVLAALVMGAMAGTARAEGGWLDQTPLVQWNAPGMVLPTTTMDSSYLDQNCVERSTRPAETDADRAVAKAGWYLVGGYQGGWGVYVVTGTTGFDGMCRPVGYQEFVFADGVFAGTVSPELMVSRGDGAANTTYLSLGGGLLVNFARYTNEDALCCPSATTSATYRIDRSGFAPVLLIESAYTSPTARS